MNLSLSQSSKVRASTTPTGPADPWRVSADDFPADAPFGEQLWFLLQYAILAPSTHNTQPWIFRIQEPAIELCADWARSLPVVDPDGRELVMSCGAALLHLRVAMHYFGHAAVVETYPDPTHPELLARVRMGVREGIDAEEILLFQSITQRHTNRQPFEPTTLPDELIAALEDAARSEGAWIQFATDDGGRQALADLIAEADRIQWADRKFRGELARWLRPNEAPGSDGIPGFAEGLGDLASHAGPFVIRTFDLGKGQAAKDREIALHSPALAVIGTDGDTPFDWLAAGQALARVLLKARSENVWASFLCQPIEVESLRPQVAQAVGREGSPQLLLRLGYAPAPRTTPRRHVREVLQDNPAPARNPFEDSDV